MEILLLNITLSDADDMTISLLPEDREILSKTIDIKQIEILRKQIKEKYNCQNVYFYYKEINKN